MPVKEAPILASDARAEINDLMADFYRAASTGDFDALDRVVSRRPGMAWIGTDPHEWWDDPAEVAKAWRTQAAEMGGPTPITGGDATVHQSGDVAWVADRPVFHLSDGRTLPFRFTVVWLREPQGWRIVQAHASFGIANETVIRQVR